MHYKNKVFEPGDTIVLDGAIIEGCDLGGCTMIYRGGVPPEMVGNRGAMPTFVFEDAAANTIALLQSLSQGGFSKVVRGTFPGLFGN